MSELWVFDNRLPKAPWLKIERWAAPRTKLGLVACFRMANARMVRIGRFHISWRMPWLRRSAIALHPELFPTTPTDKRTETK